MWCIGYLLLFSQCIWAINAQQQQSAVRCFGTGFVMDASCPANNKMFPVEVLVGSVARSTGCPDNLIKGVNTTAETLCCRQSNSGCLATYRNTQNDTVTYIYHVNCMGKQACTSYPVVRSTTSGPVVYCDTAVYHNTTTLMELKYQCIADDDFFLPTTSGTTLKSGLHNIHIVLQDYADSGISPLTQQIQCSIETSECDGQIQIVAKDLRLFSEGGQCYQHLTVNETGNNTIKTFSCSDNTNFIQNLNFYVTQTNHIILTFMNSYNQSGGYLWIQLVPVNSSHNFIVSCPPAEENPQCFPTTTESPTTIPTTIANPNSSNPEVEKKEPEDDGDNVGLIVGIVVPVVIAIAIAVVTVVCKKLKRRPEEKASLETTATDRPENVESASSPSIITQSQTNINRINNLPRSHQQFNHTSADSKSQPMLKRLQEQAETTNQETLRMPLENQQLDVITDSETPNMRLENRERPDLIDPRMRQNRLSPIQRDNQSKKPKRKKKRKNKVGTEDDETNVNKAEEYNIKDVEKSGEEMARNKVKENAEPTTEEGKKRKKKRKKRRPQTDDDIVAEGNEEQGENDEAEKAKKKKKKKHRKHDIDQNVDMIDE